MSSPSVFEVSRGIGNNIAGGLRKGKDESQIEVILSQAMQTGNPDDIQKAYMDIVTQVSPERRQDAIQVLGNIHKNLIEKQNVGKEKAAAAEAGYTYGAPPTVQAQQVKNLGEKASKPPLTANESLNQSLSRYKQRTEALLRPFVKSDALGKTFIDFDLINKDKKKDEVLSKLDKEMLTFANEQKDVYEKFGMEVPNDIQQQLKDGIQTTRDGQQMSMRLAETLENYSKQYPPAQYNGVEVTSPEGLTIISDGKSWKIKELYLGTPKTTI